MLNQVVIFEKGSEPAAKFIEGVEAALGKVTEQAVQWMFQFLAKDRKAHGTMMKVATRATMTERHIQRALFLSILSHRTGCGGWTSSACGR